MESQTAKTVKYDRQLRLWGEHGQALLESARVCLLNGSAVGTEVLKNLVLPGIGSFTVVDGTRVATQHIGNNFFLNSSSLGQSRAKCTSELLQELNEDVAGNYLDDTPERLLESSPEYFAQFTLVIATEISESTLLQLAAVCWSNHIPLVVARAYGLLGYIRIAVPEHTVIESNPENPIPDLRLDHPPPELQRFVNSIDLDSLDTAKHSHIPFVIILLKFLNHWKQQHDGKPPSSRKEQDEFKQLLKGGLRKSDEKNFSEAIAAAHRTWVPTTIPTAVQAVLADPKCEKITATTPTFWILVRALRDFVTASNEGNGFLPLNGALPDMEADTDTYVTLQTIYRQKAQEDISAVTDRVHALLLSVDRATDAISAEEIRRFCKNAFHLNVFYFRSLQDEYQTPRSSHLVNLLNDPDNNLSWYIAFRAVDQFEQAFKRYPGVFDGDVESDVPLLKKIILDVASKLGVPAASLTDEQVYEICRFGASELHNVAALIGGVASQEAIKLITHQFIPMNNTFIYNGINSTTVTEVL